MPLFSLCSSLSCYFDPVGSWGAENERNWDEIREQSLGPKPDCRTTDCHPGVRDSIDHPASQRPGLLAGARDQSRYLSDPGVESEPIQRRYRRFLTWAYWLYGAWRLWGSNSDPAAARETGIPAGPARLAGWRAL